MPPTSRSPIHAAQRSANPGTATKGKARRVADDCDRQGCHKRPGCPGWASDELRCERNAGTSGTPRSGIGKLFASLLSSEKDDSPHERDAVGPFPVEFVRGNSIDRSSIVSAAKASATAGPRRHLTANHRAAAWRPSICSAGPKLPQETSAPCPRPAPCPVWLPCRFFDPSHDRCGARRNCGAPLS